MRNKGSSLIAELVSEYKEEFRRIDRTVLAREGSLGSWVIQLTSSNFSEGVTTTTLALALFMAGAHEADDVIAVEANLRRPSFSEVLGLKSSGSLLSVLDQSHTLANAVQPVSGYGFSVLPAGDVGDRQDHDVLLTRLYGVLTELRGFYQYILVDSPPVIPFGDAGIISPLVDGTVLVVEANSTRSEVVEHALDKLRVADAKILGSVVNKREYHIPRWLYRLV
jgi:Mrp family chromosome partitioning ATPase